MSFNNLIHELLELGESNLRIKEAYVLKFGCVRISSYDEPDLQSLFPVEELEKIVGKNDDYEDKNIPKYFDAIIDALKKCPNIFDLQVDPDDDKHKFGFTVSTKTGAILTSRLFRARVNLPSRLQKYQKEIPSPEKPIEQFKVISGGSTFVAFAPIVTYPVWPQIGHEFRELLKKQIESSTPFKAPSIGPSPIHPSFYLVVRNPQKGTKPIGLKIYTINENVIIVTDPVQRKIDNLIEYIYIKSAFSLSDFYLLQLDDSLLLDYYVEIYNLFDVLSKLIQEIYAKSWWKVIGRNEVAHKGRITLTKLHSRFVEYETKYFSFTTSRTHLIERIREDRFLNKCLKYFEDITETETRFPDSLTRAIDHYEQELQSFANTQSVVVSALVGAIIGAIITAILSH